MTRETTWGLPSSSSSLRKISLRSRRLPSITPNLSFNRIAAKHYQRNHSFSEENKLLSRCPRFEYFVQESSKKSGAWCKACHSFASAAFALLPTARLKERLHKGSISFHLSRKLFPRITDDFCSLLRVCISCTIYDTQYIHIQYIRYMMYNTNTLCVLNFSPYVFITLVV